MELYKEYTRKPSDEIDPQCDLPDYVRDDLDLAYMSAPMGLPHIQGILDGKVHFGSASEGNLYSKTLEVTEENNTQLSEPKKRLKEERERLLAKEGKSGARIIPEKPRKRHSISVVQTAEPFAPPVRIDKPLPPENTDKKFWNKNIWKE